MTAADSIRQAIQMLERSANEMHRAGADFEGLREFDALVSQLKGEYSLLPQKIFDAQYLRCHDCEHCVPQHDVELYGDREVERITFECSSPGPLDCPAVKDSGFVDELDPANLVPAFLRRQAD